jgi:hypothetical protein
MTKNKNIFFLIDFKKYYQEKGWKRIVGGKQKRVILNKKLSDKWLELLNGDHKIVFKEKNL